MQKKYSIAAVTLVSGVVEETLISASHYVGGHLARQMRDEGVLHLFNDDACVVYNAASILKLEIRAAEPPMSAEPVPIQLAGLGPSVTERIVEAEVKAEVAAKTKKIKRLTKRACKREMLKRLAGMGVG